MCYLAPRLTSRWQLIGGHFLHVLYKHSERDLEGHVHVGHRFVAADSRYFAARTGPLHVIMCITQ